MQVQIPKILKTLEYMDDYSTAYYTDHNRNAQTELRVLQ